MKKQWILSLVTGLLIEACASSAPLPVAPASVGARSPAGDEAARVRENPLLVESTLPFHAPPFDRIIDADFLPALEMGMRRQLEEVAVITSQPEPPTFENTLVALERTGELLTRVSKIFFALTQASSNETLEKVQLEIAPRLAAHQDAIELDPKLFARVKSIYVARDSLGLSQEAKHLVERYHRRFLRAGAELPEAVKARLTALNQEESKLSAEFHEKLLAASNAAAIVVDDREMLLGLGEDDVVAAAEAAKARGLEGKWLLTLQNTTQQPFQSSAEVRALRERLFKASTKRAERRDDHDTRPLILRLAALRAEKARLLGFSSYAAYVLEDQMAKTPENASKLMTDMVPGATLKARGEAAKMAVIAAKEDKTLELAPWDWQYYAEQVRKAEFAIEEAQLKPYLEFDRVLQDGVFYAANLFYGLTFVERKDIPVYDPSVRVFEVFDENGASMALWYADDFKRDNKSGGAWMDSFVDQSELLATKPVVFNVCNFTRPAAGQPALLTFSDVITMFHEFGHALHGLLSSVKYPSLSGTNVPRDFVEFPSQFNENWALDPLVFAKYARHYETGAPMPKTLVERLVASRSFNQGYTTTEYLAAALLDMAWHNTPPADGNQDVESFEMSALKRFAVDVPLIPPRYRSSYFSHIWDGGYAAGYYAYLWSEVLDHDAYQWFVEHGGLSRENGRRFREMILARGGTVDVAELYRAFRGRDPSVAPLLRHRGLETPARPLPTTPKTRDSSR